MIDREELSLFEKKNNEFDGYFHDDAIYSLEWICSQIHLFRSLVLIENTRVKFSTYFAATSNRDFSLPWRFCRQIFSSPPMDCGINEYSTGRKPAAVGLRRRNLGRISLLSYAEHDSCKYFSLQRETEILAYLGDFVARSSPPLPWTTVSMNIQLAVNPPALDFDVPPRMESVCYLMLNTMDTIIVRCNKEQRF